MKKILFATIFFVFALAMTVAFHPAMAAGKPEKVEKVEVCHIIEANDVVVGFWGVVDLHFGKVIRVSANAVSAHEAHADSTSYFTNLTAIETFRAAGVHLPAANCYVSVPTGN